LVVVVEGGVEAGEKETTTAGEPTLREGN